jgi:hypothetical protein
MSTRVITGKVRLSFPNLFTPRKPNEKAEPKYSVMVLIPKSDTETMDRLRAAEAEAAEIGKAKLGKGKPSSIIKDGDAEEADTETYPERAGHWYFTTSASEQYRPGVVDRNVQPIMDPSEVYSGVYAKVSVTAFAYNTQGNKGVSLGLNNVQILGGGENLGGGKRATDEFDEVPDEDLI